MSRRLRAQLVHASYHVPQEYQAKPRPLFRTHYKNVKESEVAHEEPLSFGQSNWDFLPDLVQNKIMQMVHKHLLKEVHAELLCHYLWCSSCGDPFMNLFEAERHLSVVCKVNHRASGPDSDCTYADGGE